MNKYLIVNTGSASKKYALYENEKELIRVHLEKIAEGFSCNLIINDKTDKIEISSADYENSVEFALNKIIASGIISQKEDISTIGIRVVAPRDYFSENRKVDDEFVAKLQEAKEEVPLHIKPIFAEIEGLRKNFSQTNLIAISDSAFHKDLPAKARLYALPLKT